jgi:hypothetical protein
MELDSGQCRASPDNVTEGLDSLDLDRALFGWILGRYVEARENVVDLALEHQAGSLVAVCPIGRGLV